MKNDNITINYSNVIEILDFVAGPQLRGEKSPLKIFSPLEKCVRRCLKLLHFQGRLRKTLRLPGVPSWLRA